MDFFSTGLICQAGLCENMVQASLKALLQEVTLRISVIFKTMQEREGDLPSPEGEGMGGGGVLI